jgi:TRAP-type C4-dicarboxylate transport system substrate-binding protein
MTCKFLSRIVCSAALSLLLTAAASAETLKVSSYLPPNHTFNRMMASWSDELKQKSGGNLTLEVYPASQLGPVNRQFELVTTGVADIAIILHSATPGRFPMSELAGLPLSYPSAGQESAITSKRLTELAPDYLTAEHPDTKILWMAVTPPLKLHTRNVEIQSVDKIKGLRIRYAGKVFQEMLQAVGASPLPVPPGETADALSKGIIDGATFPFEATKSFDLGPVVKYSMTPGLASATFAVVISKAKFDGLTEAQRKLITETTGPARAEAFGKMWDESEADGLKYMTDRGVKITKLPDAEFAKLRTAILPIVEASIKRIEGDGKPAKAFFDAYTK